jgi:hypothetical protein
MKKLKSHSNQKGQSAIEFLVTFAFVLSFVFLFVRLALNFGVGYLAHYATFMASRVYMSHDNGHGSVVTVVNSAKREALAEFKKYKLDIVNLNPNKLQFNQPMSGKLNEFVGAHFTYEKPFSYIRILGGDTTVKYLTESFLGKEVPRSECFERVCWAMKEAQGDCNPAGNHFTLFDNGC